MSSIAWLVPIAIAMGLAGLAAFLWSLGNRQYDDLDGAAVRILLPEASERPLPAESSERYERSSKERPEGDGGRREG